MGGGRRRAPAALRPNSGRPLGLKQQLSRFGLPLGLVFFAAFAVTWMMLDRWSARDLAAEGRADLPARLRVEHAGSCAGIAACLP